jgi:hypothetical protein
MADCLQTGSLQSQHAQIFACILGRVIINSAAEDFHTTLQTRAGSHVSNNGPLLLWLLPTHFHSSTIPYLSQLTETICSHSLSLSDNHHHDVKTYFSANNSTVIELRHVIHLKKPRDFMVLTRFMNHEAGAH